MTRFDVWKRKMNKQSKQQTKPQTGFTLIDISNALKKQVNDAIERHKNEPPSATQVVLARSDSWME